MSRFFMGTSVVSTRRTLAMARLLFRSLLPLTKVGGVSPVPQNAMESLKPEVGPQQQLWFPVVKPS